MTILDVKKEDAIRRYDEMNDSAERKIVNYCLENGISEDLCDDLIAGLFELNFLNCTLNDILILYNALHGSNRNKLEEAYYQLVSAVYTIGMERKVFETDEDEDMPDVISFC